MRADLQIDLRDQLRILKQHGSVEDYTTEFRRLFNQVKDMSQLDAIHAYTRGLDPQVTSRLQLSAIKTLDAAIAAALDNERSMVVLKMPGPAPMDTSINVASTSDPTADQAEAYVSTPVAVHRLEAVPGRAVPPVAAKLTQQMQLVVSSATAVAKKDTSQVGVSMRERNDDAGQRHLSLAELSTPEDPW
jgi:hypothetical protein